MHDIRTKLAGTMPVLEIRPAQTPTPAGWTRVDRNGLAIAEAEHEAVFDVWRAANPRPKPPPPPSLTVSSPNGEEWAITVSETGTIGARKVT